MSDTQTLAAFLSQVSDPLSKADKATLAVLIAAEDDALSRSTPLGIEEHLQVLNRAKLRLRWINKLPNELLNHIFSLFVHDKRQDPMILRQVCPHWRDVATHSADLFQHPDLELPLHNPFARNFSIARHVAHIKLAKGPVHLSFDWFRSHGLRLQVAADQFKELVNRFASVIDALSLAMWKISIAEDLFAGLPTSPQLLLRELYLGSCTDQGPFDPRLLNLSYVNMTSLRIDLYMELPRAWELLAGCLVLEKFEFSISSGHPLDPTVMHRQTLCRLTSAVLYYSGDLASALLHMLTTPALDRLDLHGNMSDFTVSRALLGLKRRSSFNLSQVNLAETKIPPGDMVEFIQDMTLLRHIAVHFLPLTDPSEFARAFLVPSAELPPLAPILHSLTIRAPLSTAGWLMDGLEGRKSTLRCVSIEFTQRGGTHWMDDVALKARVEALCQGGMDILIN